jgi:outer membrane protein TolC
MKIFNIPLLVLICYLLISKNVHAQEAYRLSLQEAMTIAIDNNLGVKNAVLEWEKSQHVVSQAKSGLLPQIDAYSDFIYSYSIPRMAIPGEIVGQTGPIAVEFGTTYDWSFGLKASQIIYNQSYFTSIKLTQKMAEIDQLSTELQKEEIAYQVAQLYYLLAATSKQVDQLNLSLDNMHKLSAITSLKVDNEIARPAEHQRLLIEKNNLQNELSQLQLVKKQQENMLKYLLAYPPSASIELTDSLIYKPIEFTNPNFELLPEVRILAKQVEAADLQLRVQKHANLPKLSLSAQHFYQGMHNEIRSFNSGEEAFFNGGIIGLHLSIPVFGGLSRKQNLAIERINLQQMMNNRRNSLELLEKDWIDAVLSYENQHQVYQRQLNNLDMAKENYQVNLLGYQEQVVSLSDLLQSESNLAETRLALYNSLLQLKNAELKIKKLQHQFR